MRNKWHLYEWLKQRFMYTGRVPTADEARVEFRELSLDEMAEGYAEFNLMIGKFAGGGEKHVPAYLQGTADR